MADRPRMCFDRPLPLEFQGLGVEKALDENPANRSNLDLSRPTISSHPFSIAFSTARLWRPGRTLGVAFLDGSAIQQDRVAGHAVQWLDHVNLTFDFTSEPEAAQIRISFEADDGSWSALGTDCLVKEYFRPGEPTMNYGWLEDDTGDDEYRRVVLHEFGHALGAIHEHSNPAGGIIWNEAAVYQYFSGPPNNWSPQEIHFNVLQRYSADQVNGTRFDPKSIMLYSFPASLMLNMQGTQSNTDLSPGDKAMAAKMYPKGKRAGSKPASGSSTKAAAAKAKAKPAATKATGSKPKPKPKPKAKAKAKRPKRGGN